MCKKTKYFLSWKLFYFHRKIAYFHPWTTSTLLIEVYFLYSKLPSMVSGIRVTGGPLWLLRGAHFIPTPCGWEQGANWEGSPAGSSYEARVGQ